MPTSPGTSFRYKTLSLAFFLCGDKMLQCLPVLKFSVCQYKEIKLGSSSFWTNKTMCALFCTSFPKLWPNYRLQKYQKPHFCLFSDSLSESVACQSKPLHFTCHLGIFNRSWVSKYSTFPCDKGSALKNRRIKTCNTVLNKNKKKDLNQCPFGKLWEVSTLHLWFIFLFLLY